MNSSEQINLDEIPNYADVAQRIGGQKLKMVDVENKPIIIWKYEMRQSVYREQDKRNDKMYMRLDISSVDKPHEHYALGTSSYYLIDEIQQLRMSLPMKTTIIKKALPKRRLDDIQRYAYVLS